MIKTTEMMLQELSDYASPKTKLSRMVKNGECFQIVKGLYETNRNVVPHLLAASIYGPSYISFDYALAYYELIPEAVYSVTSATFEKKKKKKYITPFGTFTFRDVPSEAFPYYLEIKKDGDYYFRIASPEKALCDKLYTISPVKNTEELTELLFNDLRLDESEFKKMNLDVIADLGCKYHSTNVKKLYSVLRRVKNESCD